MQNTTLNERINRDFTEGWVGFIIVSFLCLGLIVGGIMALHHAYNITQTYLYSGEKTIDTKEYNQLNHQYSPPNTSTNAFNIISVNDNGTLNVKYNIISPKILSDYGSPTSQNDNLIMTLVVGIVLTIGTSAFYTWILLSTFRGR